MTTEVLGWVDGGLQLIGTAFMFTAMFFAAYAEFSGQVEALAMAMSALNKAVFCFAMELCGNGPSSIFKSALEVALASQYYKGVQAAIVSGLAEGEDMGGLAMKAVLGVSVYSAYCLATLASMNADNAEFSMGG